MTNTTPHIPHDDRSLFDGFKAIEEAGGVQPFAAELIAETYRITNERIARYCVDDDGGRVQVARDVVREVAHRRLFPDMRRELAYYVDRQIQAQELRSPEAIEQLTQRIYQQLQPINDRRLQVILEATGATKGEAE